jgi:catechol-2,3-dioxygenase
VKVGELEGNGKIYEAFRVHDPEGNEIEFFWEED